MRTSGKLVTEIHSVLQHRPTHGKCSIGYSCLLRSLSLKLDWCEDMASDVKSGYLGQRFHAGQLGHTTFIGPLAHACLGNPTEFCEQSPGECLRRVKTLQVTNFDRPGVRASYHIQAPGIASCCLGPPGLKSGKSPPRRPIPAMCLLLPFYLHFVPLL